MTTWLRPITGWLARDGRVPGPDVDEFAGPAEVGAALAELGGQPSLLAVQHPHRTPQARSAGLTLAEALPTAVAALRGLERDFYSRVEQVVLPYRVSGPDGTAVGLLCMVDPAAVGPDGEARVGHTEDVYPEVVAERAAVLAGLGSATSAALLVPVLSGDTLTPVIWQVVDELGEPAVEVTDAHGRTHELWLVPAGVAQDKLLSEAGAHPLLVADGNHRVAAAAAAGGGRMLAMVTSGPRLRVGAIHRVLTGTGFAPGAIDDRLRAHGLPVFEVAAGTMPLRPGTVVLVTAEGRFEVTLPAPAADEPRPRIDHAVVEDLLLAGLLGLDPSGSLVRPLPGAELPESGLPTGADAVLLLAPVPVSDVVEMHRQRRRMPRKSTYFTPKPRSGLVLADLGG